MRIVFRSTLIAVCLLAGCSPVTPVTTVVPLVVQYTPASSPWLASLYSCAGNAPVAATQRSADFLDPRSADLAIRLGQPDPLISPAYQVGTDELLVILNKQNPVANLSAFQVRGLFTGQITDWKGVGGPNSPVQVWVFAEGEDLQAAFDQVALKGSPVTMNARLASSPEDMVRAIETDKDAVGIINRTMQSSDVSDVFTVTSMPLLAITLPDSPENVMGIIACMQK